MTQEKATEVSNIVREIKAKEVEVEKFEYAISLLKENDKEFCIGGMPIISNHQAIMMAMLNKANLESEIKSLYEKLESL